MNARRRQAAKLGLFLLGVGLLAWSVYMAGPLTILKVARDGLAFLPFIALCSGAFYLLESQGQRCMLGADKRAIPLGVFIRATLSAFVATVLLPFGRAGSEVVRIAAYAPHVGLPRATAASATFQVSALLGTAVYGSVCYLVVGLALGFGTLVAWVLLLHAVGSAALGGVLLLLAQRAALGKRLARLLPRLSASAGSFDEATALPLSVFLQGVLWCSAARLAEVAQYAVVLLAVGLPLSIPQALVAGGIHIVGATVGEAIPNQLGAVEGAFLYFSGALGLRAEPARAIALPLMVRVAQYGLATVSLALISLVSLLGTRRREPQTAPNP